MFKICVLGAGYVGLVSAACLAKTGNQVIAIDINPQKIATLKNGKIDFFEPYLEELVNEGLSDHSLTFSSNISEGIKNSDIVIVAIGTPSNKDGAADISQILHSAKIIANNLNQDKIIVIKSTVPPGTCKKIDNIIFEEKKSPSKHYIVSNPEFLREGSAIKDTFTMERAIIGSESQYALKIISKLHEPFTQNIVSTDLQTSELIKYASNSFLATKISFINEFSNLCTYFEADIETLAHGMGLDSRIGDKFLKAGIGYGGSCFPKDTLALLKIADEANVTLDIVRSTINANEKQRAVLINQLLSRIPDIRHKKIAVLGMAFKPGTDDVREAPSLYIIERLLRDLANVHVYDPIALENGKHIFGTHIFYEENPYQALHSADAVIILTEWKEIINLDYVKAFHLMKNPIVIDGRNCLDKTKLVSIGYDYQGMGIKVNQPEKNQSASILFNAI